MRLAGWLVVVVFAAGCASRGVEWAMPTEPKEDVCFDLALGSWTPQPSPYLVHEPPRMIILTGEVGMDRRHAFELESRLVRPRLPFNYRESNASWRPLGNDSISVVWTNGFMGVRIAAARTPDGLEGFAESFADGVIEGVAFPRAPVRGRLRACPAKLVAS